VITLTLIPARQRARVSKITNDGLARSATQDALWLYPYDNSSLD